LVHAGPPGATDIVTSTGPPITRRGPDGSFFGFRWHLPAVSGQNPDDGGCYVLLVRLDRPADVTVGALGEHRLPAGWYGYVGSALGSGGFARVDRHRRIAAGDHDVRHWHVDYLLGHPAASLAAVSRVPGRDVECALATELGTGRGPVPGFGASDCECGSHLARWDARRAVGSAVEQFTRKGE
jgi:endonuclease-3